jgi:hypothetical protein
MKVRCLNESVKQYEITITDEEGNFICSKVPFEESRLEGVSIAAGGLGDFIEDYEIRASGKPCKDCDRFTNGCIDDCSVYSFNCENTCDSYVPGCEEECEKLGDYMSSEHEERVMQFSAYLDLKKKLNIDKMNEELRKFQEENGCTEGELVRL